ncbi:hypothetical protein [Cumulibacter soli]|uniref:hypothetical protein n=1 Tax=Cumulibacter soli TaxID=2546344 RepID=UPI0010689413|nr:hypothetical protein [Cumulibacter soli]
MQPTGPRTPGQYPRAERGSTSGRTRAGRAWLPWRSRTRGWLAETWDWIPSWGKSGGDDELSSILAMIRFILCLPLMIPAAVMTVLFLIESLAQWIVMPFAVLLRLCGVIPVGVDARDNAGRVHRERVHGWGRAKQRKRELTQVASFGPVLDGPLPPGFTPPAPPTGFQPRNNTVRNSR